MPGYRREISVALVSPTNYNHVSNKLGGPDGSTGCNKTSRRKALVQDVAPHGSAVRPLGSTAAELKGRETVGRRETKREVNGSSRRRHLS
jgi:hypothetical protein